MPRLARRCRFRSAPSKRRSLKQKHPFARRWPGREYSEGLSMSCPDHQNLSAFVDGELETTQAADVKRHIVECASCRQLVEEMQWLEDCGRASLRAIHVREATTPNIVWWRPVWLRCARPTTWAAAAAVVLVLSTWAWFALSHSGRDQTPTAPHQVASVNVTTPSASGQSEEAQDTAFEQWAAPYQRLQIPLVPMEMAANYNPTPILPILPNNN